MAMEITNTSFDQLLASGKPFMVDFWAEWCGPCKMIGPVVEEFAKEFEGRIVVGKCNVDVERDLAMRHSVRSIPTLMFFKDGKLVDKKVGALGRAELRSSLEGLL